MWVHVIAVLGLAAVCGLWYGLQRVHGGESRGVTGECGACAERRKGCAADTTGTAGPDDVRSR